MPNFNLLPALSFAALLAAAASAQDMDGAGAGDPAATDDMTGEAMADDGAARRFVQPAPPVLENGLEIDPADGDAYSVTFADDGTYKTSAGSAGGWTLQNGYLCLSDTSGALICSNVDEAAEPGSSWQVAEANGDVVTFTLPTAE